MSPAASMTRSSTWKWQGRGRPHALDPDKDGMLSSPVAIIQFSDAAVITAALSRSRSQVEAGFTRQFNGLNLL